MRRSIFLFFLILYLSTTAGHIYTIDSYLNYGITKSIGSYRKLSMPKSMMTVEGRGGRHYSKLGIGQSLANLPMYYIGGLVEMAFPGQTVFKAYSEYVYIPHDWQRVRAEPQTIIRISELDGAWIFFATLTNAFIAAAACLLFFLTLRGFGVGAPGSFLGTSILALGTPFWVYARDLFGEPLFALSLLGTFYFLANPGRPLSGRRAALAGAFSSIGILTRMSFAPIVGIFALYIILAPGGSKDKPGLVLRYILWSLPGLIVVGLLNWVRFESILASGYHTAFDKGFSVPVVKGIVYNLFSPYRSLFLYAPPVLVFFFGAAYFAGKHRAHLVLIALITVYMFLLYSRWWAWHGGWCWGPRFYLPIIPLLMLPGLVYVQFARKRKLLWTTVGLGIAGFLVQLGAVFINYTAVYDYWIKIGILDWSEAGIHMFSPITTHWKAILATNPSQYDLWLVQGVREAGPAVLIVAALLVAGAIAAAGNLKREITGVAGADHEE